MSRLLAYYSLLVWQIACHSQPGLQIKVNTVDIETYSEANAAYIPQPILARANDASVYLRTRTSSCSGTYIQTISGPKIITSAHCFDNAHECRELKVYFAKPNRKAVIRACAANSFRAHAESDLAVFALARPPPQEFKPLTLWTAPLHKPRAAFIIHYPRLNPRQAASINTRYVTGIDCYAESAFSFYQRLVNALFFYGLAHTCDIAAGSSGAGLIDLETAKVLGVIWGDVLVYTDAGVQQHSGATHYRYVRRFLSNQPLPAATLLNTVLGYLRD
ncbi:MAG: serine protease [Pseudomonadota bacterium]|nr:serine protease [Pseudomonadota bacterium]